MRIRDFIGTASSIAAAVIQKIGSVNSNVYPVFINDDEVLEISATGKVYIGMTNKDFTEENVRNFIESRGLCANKLLVLKGAGVMILTINTGLISFFQDIDGVNAVVEVAKRTSLKESDLELIPEDYLDMVLKREFVSVSESVSLEYKDLLRSVSQIPCNITDRLSKSDDDYHAMAS